MGYDLNLVRISLALLPVLTFLCRLLAGQKDLHGKDGMLSVMSPFVIHPDLLQLYEDMSTWRSEMKKVATVAAPLLYELTPAPRVECPDPISFTKNAAADLLREFKFLRNGRDENVSVLLCTNYMF